MFDDGNTSPAIKRLIALIDKGYRIDEVASRKVGDTIWLEHPARSRAAESTLLVDGDGRVIGIVPLDNREKQLQIGPKDAETFQRFLASVPKATCGSETAGIRT